MVAGLRIGDYAITTRTLDSLTGSIEYGARVQVIGISDRGYDVTDNKGNTVTETGFYSIREE